MTRRRTTGLLRTAVTAVTALALAVLSACGGSPTDSRGASYVALGDSYTAGPGIKPTTNVGCGRSAADYPSLLAVAAHLRDFVDNSCSGAQTADLTHRQHTARADNRAQLDGVGPDTRLVTIGIGLNDFHLSSGLLLICLPVRGTYSAACRTIMDMPTAAMEQQLDRAAANVRSALERIRRRAPKARVILVGYPRLVPDSGTCPQRLPMPAAMIAQLRTAMAYVDEAWRRAADAAGAEYLDTYRLSEGHDICATAPWIDGLSLTLGTGSPLHPLSAYHRAVADALVKMVG